MAPSMVKTILFDIGEVIIHTNFSSVYVGVAERLGIQPRIIQNYFKKYLNQSLVGELGPAHVLATLNLRQVLTVDQFLDIWKEEITRRWRIDESMVELLRTLRQHYTVVATTNLTEERYAADMSIGLYDFFDHAVLSLKEGVKKPDARYFELALARANARPDEALFIDDQQKMIDGAHELGIPTIQFTDYEALVEKLRAMKIEGV